MNIERINPRDRAGVSVSTGAGLADRLDLSGTYHVECIGADGNVKWADTIENLVTTEGKNALLTHALKASSLTQTVVLGLVESTGFSAFGATNTAANITAVGGASPTNGWNEATTSQCAARGSPSFGSASAGSLATSSAVSFSMLATATMKGAFLMVKSIAGTAPTTTPGNTSGALYSCGPFSGGDRAVINGDTLNVTYTASA